MVTVIQVHWRTNDGLVSRVFENIWKIPPGPPESPAPYIYLSLTRPTAQRYMRRSDRLGRDWHETTKVTCSAGQTLIDLWHWRLTGDWAEFPLWFLLLFFTPKFNVRLYPSRSLIFNFNQHHCQYCQCQWYAFYFLFITLLKKLYTNRRRRTALMNGHWQFDTTTPRSIRVETLTVLLLVVDCICMSFFNLFKKYTTDNYFEKQWTFSTCAYRERASSTGTAYYYCVYLHIFSKFLVWLLVLAGLCFQRYL